MFVLDDLVDRISTETGFGRVVGKPAAVGGRVIIIVVHGWTQELIILLRVHLGVGHESHIVIPIVTDRLFHLKFFLF